MVLGWDAGKKKVFLFEEAFVEFNFPLMYS